MLPVPVATSSTSWPGADVHAREQVARRDLVDVAGDGGVITGGPGGAVHALELGDRGHEVLSSWVGVSVASGGLPEPVVRAVRDLLARAGGARRCIRAARGQAADGRDALDARRAGEPGAVGPGAVRARRSRSHGIAVGSTVTPVARGDDLAAVPGLPGRAAVVAPDRACRGRRRGLRAASRRSRRSRRRPRRSRRSARRRVRLQEELVAGLDLDLRGDAGLRRLCGAGAGSERDGGADGGASQAVGAGRTRPRRRGLFADHGDLRGRFVGTAPSVRRGAARVASR